MASHKTWPEIAWDMITNGDQNVIKWIGDGSNFLITSKIEFEKPGGVLEKYFGVLKGGYDSFSRSCLNHNIFTVERKLPELERSHAFKLFHRDHPEKLKYIFNREALQKYPEKLILYKSIIASSKPDDKNLNFLVDASISIPKIEIKPDDKKLNFLVDASFSIPKPEIKLKCSNKIKYINSYVKSIKILSVSTSKDNKLISDLKIYLREWLEKQSKSDEVNDNILK
jgi:hypothetical protein